MTDSPARIGRYRNHLRAGRTLVGTFLKTPSAAVAEILGLSELDCVCIDAEHAPFGREAIDRTVATLRLLDKPSLVRVPAARPDSLLGALDSGATGVLVPHVASGADAEAIVKHALFGRGGRGYAGSTRAARFGARTTAEHLAASAAETTLVAQIEDAEALDALDDILAVDRIDAVFIGRMDLTISLGATSPQAPEVVDAVATIVGKAKAAGRTVGMFTPTVEEARRWRERGASLFLLGSDHGFLMAGADGLAKALHG